MPEKQQEEFELVPMTPIRRLEKRIEQLETSSTTNTSQFFKDIVDIVRMNQQIVDDLAKANDALRIELSKLPARIEELVESLQELLSYIKASASEEVTGAGVSPDALKPLTDKLDQLIDINKKIIESNQSVLSALDEIGKKLSRPTIPQIRKPMMPPRPAPRPVV